MNAKYGYVFIRKADERLMGHGICLAKNDTIENYEQRECTAEEMAIFYPEKQVRKPHSKAEQEPAKKTSKRKK